MHARTSTRALGAAAWTVGLAAAGSVALRGVAAAQDRTRNGVCLAPPYVVRPEVRALHERLTVVDLHVDSLLWRRDLSRRSDVGHVDLPRLREANVALVVLDAVTQVPAGLNFERNDAGRDLITLLSVAQGRPPGTWTSRLARTLDTSARLHALAESDGKVRVVRTAADLTALLAERERDREVVGALLGIEGSHALDGRADGVEVIDRAGFRMVGLQHFFDNAAGGSAHGLDQPGLTGYGRDLVRELEAHRILVDVAHSAPAVVDDVLAMAARPVVVSHTGVRAVCDNERNLTDDHLRGVAGTGGMVGIAMFEHAVGGRSVRDTARAVRHAVGVAGIAHVGLGSDFDGAITTHTDVTGLPLLTQALVDEGFTEDQVAAVMGGNAIRLLQQTLT